MLTTFIGCNSKFFSLNFNSSAPISLKDYISNSGVRRGDIISILYLSNVSFYLSFLNYSNINVIISEFIQWLKSSNSIDSENISTDS